MCQHRHRSLSHRHRLRQFPSRIQRKLQQINRRLRVRLPNRPVLVHRLQHEHRRLALVHPSLRIHKHRARQRQRFIPHRFPARHVRRLRLRALVSAPPQQFQTLRPRQDVVRALRAHIELVLIDVPSSQGFELRARRFARHRRHHARSIARRRGCSPSRVRVFASRVRRGRVAGAASRGKHAHAISSRVRARSCVNLTCARARVRFIVRAAWVFCYHGAAVTRYSRSEAGQRTAGCHPASVRDRLLDVDVIY